MAIVIDTSIVFGFSFTDESNEYSDFVLEKSRIHELVVPSVFVYEVANVIRTNSRKLRWGPDEIKGFLDILNDLPIKVIEFAEIGLVSELEYFAEKTKLTAYDAAYLMLCKREGLLLATLGNDLRNAAKAEGVFLEMER